MNKLNARGFTPVELAGLIVVFALIIGIGLARYQQVQNEAVISKTKAEMKTLQAAIESYMVHNQQYPAQSTTPLKSWQSGLLKGPSALLTSILDDPFSPTTEYRYVTDSTSDSKYYVIFSVGPDGRAGITGISDTGKITGDIGDDIYISNATPIVINE